MIHPTYPQITVAKAENGWVIQWGRKNKENAHNVLAQLKLAWHSLAFILRATAPIDGWRLSPESLHQSASASMASFSDPKKVIEIDRAAKRADMNRAEWILAAAELKLREV